MYTLRSYNILAQYIQHIHVYKNPVLYGTHIVFITHCCTAVASTSISCNSYSCKARSTAILTRCMEYKAPVKSHTEHLKTTGPDMMSVI